MRRWAAPLAVVLALAAIAALIRSEHVPSAPAAPSALPRPSAPPSVAPPPPATTVSPEAPQDERAPQAPSPDESPVPEQASWSEWTISGTVVDATGAPVVSATVRGGTSVQPWWEKEPPEQDWLVGTDAHGRYSAQIPGQRREVTLEARAPGFAAARHPRVCRMDRLSARVEVEPLVLERAGALVVKTRTSDEKALGNVQLELDEETGWDRKGVTDASGEKRFDGLLPGSYFLTLSVTRGDAYLMEEREAVRVRPGETTELEVILAPAKPLRVLVVDSRGQPVAGARVLLIGPWAGRAFGGHTSYEYRTDAAGLAVAPWPPPSDLVVSAHSDDRGLAATTTVPATDRPHEVRLVLEPAPRIVARLVDGTGAPLRTLQGDLPTFFLTPPGGTQYVVSRDVLEHGRELPLLPGRWRFSVAGGIPRGANDRELPWYESTEEIELRPGERPELGLRLGTASVHVRLKGPDGPCHGQALFASVDRADGRPRFIARTWPLTAGVPSELPRLRAGRYDVYAESGDLRHHSQLALAEGQVLRDLELQLHPRPRLTGTVMGPDGEPLGGVRVRLGSNDHHVVPELISLSVGEGTAVTDGRGRFDLSRWVHPGGTYDVSVHPGSLAGLARTFGTKVTAAPASVTVRPGGQHDVTVRVTR